MTQRKGLRGILALLCAMTLLIGAIGPAWATEAAVPESVAVTTAATPEGTPVAQTTKAVIASWNWVDPDKRVNQGVMEVSDKEGAVDYNGVYSLLPKEITATVEGQTAPVTIAVTDWLCPEFDASVPGDYTFKAEIAQDYTLGANVPALEVKVRLIQEQPVADAPADTTGNTTAPAAPTPPTTEKITAPKCSCEIRCAQDAVKADCPVCSAEGAKLDEVCTGAAPVTLEEKPQSLASGMILYVGDQNITADGYWTTDGEGKLTVADSGNWNVHYETASNTLTLKNAKLTGITQSGLPIEGINAGILAYGNGEQNVSLTVKVEGDSQVAGGTGIYAWSDSGTVTLSISGTAKLTANGTSWGGAAGIAVQSNNNTADLAIDGVDVTATNENAQGIWLRSGENSKAALTVNDGKLTVSGKNGIDYVFGSGTSGSGAPSLIVTGNAVVDAKNGGISDNSTADVQVSAGAGANGGIVFNGKDGAVYGNVDLQEDLTINEGETLTVGDGASLNTGSNKLTVNGGTVNGTPTGNVTYLVTGVTLDKNQLTLLPGESADLKATVKPDNATDKSVKWVSDKPEFATVDQQGTVTAVKSGTATITATATDGSGKTATCTVTVNSGISANPAALDFGSATVNYTTAPKAQTVTITNNTNQTVTLNQPTNAKYDFVLSETELAAKETATVTVQPKTALPLGDHKESVTVSSTAGNVTIQVSFKVVELKITFQNYTGKIYDGKPMANPTKDQLTVTGADFSEVTFTWYKDTKDEKNKLTSAPADAGTYVLVAAVAKTDSHDATEAQQTITIAKADATDAMKKAEGTLTKNHPDSLALPKLPDGASYGIPTAEGTYVTDLAVKDGKLSYKGTGNVKNDGKYEVRVPVTGAKNYSDYTIVVTLTGADKLPVTLTAANFTTTYNGSEVFPEAIHKTATYDGEAVSGKWSFVGGNPKDANVDESAQEQTKVLKFTPKDTEKYAEASIEVKVVIKKAPLKVSVKLSKTKIAVNSKLPTVSLSYSGLMGNDKMEPKVEPKFEGMPSGKKTGTYTIKLKNVDEMKEAINDLPVSKNYDITYVTSAKLSVVSGNNPLTADTSNIGMWTAIMIISGIGLIVVLVVMVVLNKKSKRRRPRYRRTPPKQED